MDSKTDDSHAHHPRVEDDYLVRGNGRFVADAAEPGQTTAAFVRTPMPASAASMWTRRKKCAASSRS